MMLTISVPGREPADLHHLVLDFNGTIALDGHLLAGVKERLMKLSEQLAIYVITADTNGSVAAECADLPVRVHVIGKTDQIGEKTRFVQELLPAGAACIGNGVNDEGMFAVSELAVAIMGTEGCAVSSLLQADIVVSSITDALDLLLLPHRLIATLRK